MKARHAALICDSSLALSHCGTRDYRDAWLPPTIRLDEIYTQLGDKGNGVRETCVWVLRSGALSIWLWAELATTQTRVPRRALDRGYM